MTPASRTTPSPSEPSSCGSKYPVPCVLQGGGISRRAYSGLVMTPLTHRRDSARVQRPKIRRETSFLSKLGFDCLGVVRPPLIHDLIDRHRVGKKAVFAATDVFVVRQFWVPDRIAVVTEQ